MSGKGMRAATITVFGSGSPELSAADCELAHRLGAELARRGFTLCNGGYGGTMEEAARGAREAGGRVVGVTLRRVAFRPNPWLDEVFPQPDLPARIMGLLDRGDGYIVLGGGTGTLAEIGLLLELQNKGFMPRRPVVFLGRFWRPLLELLSDEPLLRELAPFQPVEGIEMLGPLACTDSPEAAVRYLAVNLGQSPGEAP